MRDIIKSKADISSETDTILRLFIANRMMDIYRHICYPQYEVDSDHRYFLHNQCLFVSYVIERDYTREVEHGYSLEEITDILNQNGCRSDAKFSGSTRGLLATEITRKKSALEKIFLKSNVSDLYEKLPYCSTETSEIMTEHLLSEHRLMEFIGLAEQAKETFFAIEALYDAFATAERVYSKSEVLRSHLSAVAMNDDVNYFELPDRYIAFRKRLFSVLQQKGTIPIISRFPIKIEYTKEIKRGKKKKVTRTRPV